MRKRVILASLAALFLLQVPSHNQDLWLAALNKARAVAGIVEENYYKPVEESELAAYAVRGVLDTLDPHSYFLDPEGYSRMREDYTGRYYGVGLQIQKQGDNLVVISPIEGGPGWRLGIQPGDVILTIDGESTVPLSSYDAMQKLRGEKGAKVTITISREGLDKPLELTIEREEIPLLSIPYVFMLDEKTAYVYIRNFAGNTPDELQSALEKLSRQGMKSLVLDLRLNPGGALRQCIEVADMFLPKGALVVSIRGRNKAYNTDFYARYDGQYEKVPLVVLIDQGSASASEIVSGAVMDHDRGLVVGEDSWGKGLVQTVFQLAPDTAVALTVAKYLTPSGRSIQRDYSQIDDYLLSKKQPEQEREATYTDHGRKVLGQGGITPDYKVDSLLKPVTGRLRLTGAFFGYARKLHLQQTELGKRVLFLQDEKGAPVSAAGKLVVRKPFQAGPEFIADFRDYLVRSKISFDEKALEEAEDEVKRELEREVTAAVWGFEEGVRVSRLSDPAVLKAMEVMPEAAVMLERMLASAAASAAEQAKAGK
jgi:carboxyl-terminal processing protease